MIKSCLIILSFLFLRLIFSFGPYAGDEIFVQYLVRDLTQNYINGTIPITFGQLRLKILGLIDNRLSGSIPPEIADIDTLEQHGLISHQLTSYNDFIKHGQNVCDSIGEITVQPSYDPSKKGDGDWRFTSVRFGKVKLAPPTFFTGKKFYNDNAIDFVDFYLRHARLQNMTCSSKMKVEVHLQVWNGMTQPGFDEFRRKLYMLLIRDDEEGLRKRSLAIRSLSSVKQFLQINKLIFESLMDTGCLLKFTMLLALVLVHFKFCSLASVGRYFWMIWLVLY